MKKLLLLMLCFSAFMANAQETNGEKKLWAKSFLNQKAPELVVEQWITAKPETTGKFILVDFWATWCGPCVQELPYFMEVNERFRNKKFQMVLVSLDNPDKLEESVMDFVNRFGLDRARLYLLDDVKNMNEWIPDVDPSWGGTIPATLIIKNKTNLWFAAEALTLEELTKQIEQFI